VDVTAGHALTSTPRQSQFLHALGDAAGTRDSRREGLEVNGSPESLGHPRRSYWKERDVGTL